MDEVMTRCEIESRFHGEWVLIADPEVDEELRVVRGRVVHHSKDRDEVDRKMVELRLKSSATLYTGEIPENTAVVL
jgi:DNA helicase HerA-like ATPase